jgi:hypothetical protein
VGPGTVLRNIIDSGMVPVVRLTEVFRQAAHSRKSSVSRTTGTTPHIDDIRARLRGRAGDPRAFQRVELLQPAKGVMKVDED